MKSLSICLHRLSVTYDQTCVEVWIAIVQRIGDMTFNEHLHWWICHESVQRRRQPCIDTLNVTMLLITIWTRINGIFEYKKCVGNVSGPPTLETPSSNATFSLSCFRYSNVCLQPVKPHHFGYLTFFGKVSASAGGRATRDVSHANCPHACFQVIFLSSFAFQACSSCFSLTGKGRRSLLPPDDDADLQNSSQEFVANRLSGDAWFSCIIGRGDCDSSVISVSTPSPEYETMSVQCGTTELDEALLFDVRAISLKSVFAACAVAALASAMDRLLLSEIALKLASCCRVRPSSLRCAINKNQKTGGGPLSS